MRYSLRRWFTSTMASLNVNLMLSKFRIQLIVESLRMIPYNPPILKSVERGDLSQIQTLMTTRNSSICNRDSDGFGFLYQATHYCLRASGPLVAMNMCKALLDMGVNGGQEDEIGKTPCDTLIDQILVASALQRADTCGFENDQICDVAVLFNLSSYKVIDEYQATRQFTPVPPYTMRYSALTESMDLERIF